MTPSSNEPTVAARVLRPFERLGAYVLSIVVGSIQGVALVAGALAWCVVGRSQGQPVRFSAIAKQVVDLGYSSLPLTLVFAVAIGVVMAMEASRFLEVLDLQSLVVQVISRSLVRDIAPLLVGILAASRNGSGIAAQLSSMNASSEVAALAGMGVDPLRFLVAPALIGMLLATPILALLLAAVTLGTISFYLSISEGMTVLFLLGEALRAIDLADILLCIFKSVVFGGIITAAAAACGLSREAALGGSGRSVNKAVVIGVTNVLIGNAVISILATF